jgi:uncharacterized DUF497 family protein
MKITGTIRLDSVVEKIEAKHGVSREEVHQVVQSQAMFRFVENGHRRGEHVSAALGQTKAGRDLTVFFVHKLDQRILIVTARGMSLAERRQYEKRRRQEESGRAKKQHLQGRNVRRDRRLLG